MEKYDHRDIEKKWRKKWEKSALYKTKEPALNLRKSASKPKCYVLDMFPYLSGEGLHVGHPKGYIATDIYSRFKKMRGFNVLHPMGFDAFGLPAENYAIKNKVHPKVAMEKNIKRFKEQLSILGFNYDWDREINTSDPKYYKWTQWIFLKFLEKGLAYESWEPINWCPKDKTGLANEDVEDGKCERCGTPVIKKPMRQWVLKITDYAEKMLDGLKDLNWPESIKESQRNWIGKSEGVNFKCSIKDLNIEVQMYNSVPQSYHAETFTAIAPEHPLVYELVKGTPQEKDVLEFVERIKAKKAGNKFNIDEDLEGIFIGRFIENFADTGRDLPIWVASYVLYDYGTGIVNCSAHDVRDFAFAKKYNLPLRPVTFPLDPIEREKVKKLEYCYARDPQGVLEEPKKFRGRKWGEAREDIINHIIKGGYGVRKINYKLKDWVFSRQRYWGEPIPVIHCEKCGVVPVPEKDLPVELPKVKFYEPTDTGESPLANIEKWVNVKCPKCKGPAKRETNTMPQWAGSSWYYLRYEDPKNKKVFVDKEKEKYWSPVDFYVGGAEHATRHLIYARFWHKFLFDLGLVNYPEPFSRLQNVGLIGGADGRKMSKRFGNVVNPDKMVELYGADTFRMYEMFMGPFADSIPWSTEGMIGPRRFLEKVWRLREKIQDSGFKIQEKMKLKGDEKLKSEVLQLTTTLHRTIKKVGEDIENFKFNTAISTLMILANEMEKEETISKEDYEKFLIILAPFAPHITEEIWESLGHRESIHNTDWPVFDEKAMVSETKIIMIQVDGKVRASLTITGEMSEKKIEEMALGAKNVEKWISGKKIKKVIVVKDKIVSIVTEEQL
ncbi:MAG: leucine--tRNA ligase [Candidatus Taylorbacteria bacterium]